MFYFLRAKEHRGELMVQSGVLKMFRWRIRNGNHTHFDRSSAVLQKALAIHLGARLALGDLSGLDELVANFEGCFERPMHWGDWPAAVLAECMARVRGSAAAAAFVRRYVREIRRELYSPPSPLAAYCAEAEGVLPLNPPLPHDDRRLARSG